MSTPKIHESTSHAEGELDPGYDPKTWRIKVIGLFGGIIAALLVYFLFPADTGFKEVMDLATEQGLDEKKMAGFAPEALRVAAFAAVLMGAWWMFDAIPLAATALLPLVIFPLMMGGNEEVGASYVFGKVSPSYAAGTIFLFMGGFMIALAMQRWNLHRRIALRTVWLVGTKPRQLVLGFMLATGFMSMWVSNTATAVMMLPIGLSIIKLVESMLKEGESIRNFSTSLMLGIAYAASIGSLATPIGTPPNAILIGNLKEAYGVDIGFGQWMIMGFPLALVFLVAAWAILVFVVFKPEINEIPGGRELIKDEITKMGKMSRQEIMVGTVFLLTAIAWVFVPFILQGFEIEMKIPDEAIAMIASALLFLIPTSLTRGIRLLDWKTAKELPWDVLLLFGGGLALSKQFENTGLSLWIGVKAKALAGMPMILVIILVALIILALTELTSNTATAAAFIPIMAGVAQGIGLTAGGATQNVMWLTVPVALAATCAFMLPVATPPNAIAYGSGYVQISDMIKGGILIGLIGLVLITIVVYTLAPVAFGLTLV